MNAPLILLHEKALRVEHPVFSAAPAYTKTIFVWDDAYFKQANYSIKRLIFIYETLCELPVDIIWGNTREVVKQLAPAVLWVPSSNHPEIKALIHQLKTIVEVQVVSDAPFVNIKRTGEWRRFFHYWKKAEKVAFLKKGGADD